MHTTTTRPTSHTWLHWIVWGIAALYYLYDYTQQVAPSAMGPDLIRAFHMEAETLGIIASFYFYSYAVLQIPVGLITDHFGPRRPLALAALLAAGGSLLFSVSGSTSALMLARLLIGAGTAFAYVGLLKMSSNWFPASMFATLVGLAGIVGNLGGIAGEAPLAALVNRLGWRGVMVLWAVIGAAIAALIFFIVRNDPPGTPQGPEHPDNKRTTHTTLQTLKHIVTHPQAWIGGLYAGSVNVTLSAFGALWGTPYLQAAYSMSKVDAAGTISMLFVGAIPGNFFFGWFSDKIRRRKFPMVLAAVGGLLVMVGLVYIPNLPLLVLYALVILLGFFTSGIVLPYALAHDVSRPRSAGVASGFVNTCAAVGSAVSQPAIGLLLDLFASGKPGTGGSPGYAAADFRTALTLIVICWGLALIASLLVRETHCQQLYATEA